MLLATTLVLLLALSLRVGPVRAFGAQAAGNGPVLSLPEGQRVGAPGTVAVPLRFARNNSGITSMAFGLELDHPCLAAIAETPDAVGDLVTFHVPPQFRGSASFHAHNGGGQLQIVVADYTPPLSTLPDLDVLLELRLQLTCEPTPDAPITIPLTFSTVPPPSFGNTLGRSVAGAVHDGSLVVEYGFENPTPTPTPTPDPDETPEPVNSAPQARDDSAETTEYHPVTINVLANDTDPDGDRLTVTEVTQGAFGAVTINVDSTVTYLPAPGRNGQDLFVYTVDDGRGGLDIATVTVDVRGVNVPPVAQDDFVTTDEDTPVTFAPLDNDYDPDAADPQNPDEPQLRVAVLGQPAHGTVAHNEDQTITFTPASDFAGTDTFLYAVLDQEGASAVARVHLTVRPVNDPPVIAPPARRTFGVGETVSLPLEYSDVDDDDATLTATVIGLPPGLTFDPTTRRIVGEVAAGSEGSYPSTIRVADDEATATLDVVWLVVADIDTLFGLYGYVTADGIALEVSTPPDYALSCYELYRSNTSVAPAVWTVVAPRLTPAPAPDEPHRLLDDSLSEPGVYVYRLLLFEDCDAASRELRSNRVDYALPAPPGLTYLPWIVTQ